MKTVYYIYKITNLINNKVYIGQSVSPKIRWSRHKSDARLNKKADHLYRAMRKYGEDNFMFEVIDEVVTLSEADELEVQIISIYNSTNRVFGYNKAPGGQGKRLVSEETRQKLSKAAKGRQSRLGHSPSSETRILLSKAQLGNTYRLGFKTSEETKKKLSKINKGKKASAETKGKMSQSMMGKNKGKCNGMFGVRSQDHPMAKLTFNQAEAIRLEYKTKQISMAKLAAKYNVSKRTILNIIHNRIYTNP